MYFGGKHRFYSPKHDERSKNLDSKRFRRYRGGGTQVLYNILNLMFGTNPIYPQINRINPVTVLRLSCKNIGHLNYKKEIL